MRTQLEPMLDPITVGLVRYQESPADPYNTIQFLFTKLGHFAREKELRIMLQCYDPLATVNRHLDAKNVPSRELAFAEALDRFADWHSTAARAI